ncbi:MAG TPA: TRAP transporter small permease [Xanthomonadales bacterium]|nr:TRAP transporter small permease [Xanthomonadales bacterium]
MIARLLRTLHRAEDALLAGLIGSLLLVAVGQIVLRVGFATGFAWIEPVARMGVLWLALLGALGASRQHRHIAIDALPQVLPESARRVAWRLAQLGAAVVAGALAWHAQRLVAMEHEAPVNFVTGVPSWIPMLILPIGFGLIAVRSLLAALGPAPAMPNSTPDADSESGASAETDATRPTGQTDPTSERP